MRKRSEGDTGPLLAWGAWDWREELPLRRAGRTWRYIGTAMQRADNANPQQRAPGRGFVPWRTRIRPGGRGVVRSSTIKLPPC